MGHDTHHAIIVTTWDEERAIKAQEKARLIFPQVSALFKAPINDWHTFFIPPDGSKEGWDDSNFGDSRREHFLSWLNQQRYDDGSTAYRWVEVQYGDDSGDNRVVQDENTNKPPSIEI